MYNHSSYLAILLQLVFYSYNTFHQFDHDLIRDNYISCCDSYYVLYTYIGSTNVIKEHSGNGLPNCGFQEEVETGKNSFSGDHRQKKAHKQIY